EPDAGQRAEPERRAGLLGRAPPPATAAARGGGGDQRGQLGRGHPTLPAISVTIPDSLSKYFLLTSVQPPRSAIVVSLATVGYGFDGSFAPSTVPGSTPCSAGRKPLLAKIFWPASLSA